MPTNEEEFLALQAIIQALQPFDADDRDRILKAAALFLQIPASEHMATSGSYEIRSPNRERASDVDSERVSFPAFSTPDTTSPKDFLFEKQPRTDVERVAALAFYLTHYRDTPHFKTLDLSKLNTEAAQPKFANAATSASNAVKQGYLVPSTKGMRQLSAAGERFVAALPDREAARAAMSTARPKRRPARKPGTPASSSGRKASRSD
ncbi:hypothetical protein [Mycobacterium sp. 852014-50255_SCH5639931]|uniref:hypothetical protein n=1 Tax=Mycobacterium sp. 852014-50255_SCH5639931 TaxID=1834112 RepID=UPI0007FFD664|nr:hypothetical protein [Mycobacterium sp. 852014-50255_SCH5639931]OBB64586.1 hypothetical protein A5758_20315 [Mycobacterium sp. 852014-50255_SCH5639931]